MKIKEIKVEKLFGMFNHNILLNNEIKIIHGLNGIGKTIILKMIYDLFNLDIKNINAVPFYKFKINFGNDLFIEIRKNDLSDDLATNKLKIKYRVDSNIEEIKTINVKELVDKKEISELFKLTSVWEFEAEKDEWKKFRKNLDNDFKQFLNSQKVILIDTQRLIKYEPSRNKDYSLLTHQDKKNVFRTVEEYSKDLSNRINLFLSTFAESSQKRDSTFPDRFLNEPISIYEIKELEIKLNELKVRTQLLQKIGILEKDQNEINISIPKAINETDRKVLSLYIVDFNKKFDVFNWLSERLIVFEDLLNSLMFFKKIEVNKKEGFFFITQNEKIVPPSNLSSGEQHEVVILYDLLFNVEEGSLVLIDEPEISLNLEWQRNFLQNLRRIIELSKIDVILATHSAQIINNNWDLTTELKGFEEQMDN